jgi:1,4-dihydroxy-2-naphthoate octaprenyltransferase
MAGFKAFVGVARGPFLLLPITLVASGAAASFYGGAFRWSRTLVALLGLIALHMAVNILNEWSDMKTGIDLQTRRTPFSGGSGTLPGGGMTQGGALAFGLVCATIGLATGIWFVAQVGWILLPVLVVGAVCALGYTDFLARLGLGELSAGLGLGALPVIGVALVQTGDLGAAAVQIAIAAAIPAFFMTFNLLLLNEFPDEEADRAGGRRNVVILFGRKTAAWVFSAAAIATPVAILVAVAMGVLPKLTLAALLPSLLLIKPLQWAWGDTTLAVPIPALGANVAWNLATNLFLATTLVAATIGF